MAETIEELVVKIAADTSDIKKSLKEAANATAKFAKDSKKSLDRFEKSIESVGNSLTKYLGPAAVAAIGYGFVKLTTSMFDYADAIGKSADAASISTDTLQELRYAGELAGVSIEQMDKSLAKFSSALGQFIITGSGPGRDAFNSLGLGADIINKKLRGTEPTLTAVLQNLSQVQDGTIRAGIASRLFGEEAGPKMALLLKDGIAGLDDMRQKAHDMGLVLDEETIRSAEQTNDKLATLGTILKNQVTKALVEAAPEIQKFIDALIDHRQDIEDLVKLLGGVAYVFAATARGAIAFAKDFGLMSKSTTEQIQEIDRMLQGEKKAYYELNGEFLTYNQLLARRADLVKQNSIENSRYKKIPASTTPPASPTGGNVNPEGNIQVDKELLKRQQAVKSFNDVVRAEYIKTIDDTNAKLAEQAKFDIQKMRERVDMVQEGTEERKQAEAAFYDYVELRTENLLRDQETAAQKLLRSWTHTTEALNNASAGWISSTADAITDLATKGKADFKALADSIIRDIVRIMIQQSLAGILAPVFGTPGTNGVAVPGGVPGKAGGGRVQANTPTMVGERGRELLLTSAPTTVVPNSTLNATQTQSTQPVQVSIQNQGTPQKVKGATATMTPSGIVISIVTEDFKRGGPISTAISQTFGLSRRT